MFATVDPRHRIIECVNTVSMLILPRVDVVALSIPLHYRSKTVLFPVPNARALL